MSKTLSINCVSSSLVLCANYSLFAVFRMVLTHLIAIASWQPGKTDLSRYTKNCDRSRRRQISLVSQWNIGLPYLRIRSARLYLLHGLFYLLLPSFIKIASLASYRFIHFIIVGSRKTMTPTATYQRNVVATRYFIHFIYFFCGVSMDHL